MPPKTMEQWQLEAVEAEMELVNTARDLALDRWHEARRAVAAAEQDYADRLETLANLLDQKIALTKRINRLEGT